MWKEKGFLTATQQMTKVRLCKNLKHLDKKLKGK